MTHFYIDDYGLTPEQLASKHAPDGDDEHPGFPIDVWRLRVHDGDTLQGYWNWVRHQLQLEEDELDRDNPYNQGE
jgi:hypothetical protein